MNNKFIIGLLAFAGVLILGMYLGSEFTQMVCTVIYCVVGILFSISVLIADGKLGPIPRDKKLLCKRLITFTLIGPLWPVFILFAYLY